MNHNGHCTWRRMPIACGTLRRLKPSDLPKVMYLDISLYLDIALKMWFNPCLVCFLATSIYDPGPHSSAMWLHVFTSAVTDAGINLIHNKPPNDTDTTSCCPRESVPKITLQAKSVTVVIVFVRCWKAGPNVDTSLLGGHIISLHLG